MKLQQAVVSCGNTLLKKEGPETDPLALPDIPVKTLQEGSETDPLALPDIHVKILQENSEADPLALPDIPVKSLRSSMQLSEVPDSETCRGGLHIQQHMKHDEEDAKTTSPTPPSFTSVGSSQEPDPARSCLVAEPTCDPDTDTVSEQLLLPGAREHNSEALEVAPTSENDVDPARPMTPGISCSATSMKKSYDKSTRPSSSVLKKCDKATNAQKNVKYDKSEMDGRFACAVCEKSFRSQSVWIRHMRFHLNVNRLTSNASNNRLARKNDVTKHSASLPAGYSVDKGDQVLPSNSSAECEQPCVEDRAFLCDVCGEKFTTECSLSSHARLHCIPDAPDTQVNGSGIFVKKRRFSCDECGKYFSTKGNLLRHSLKHSGKSPFQCETCGRACFSNAHLTRHMRVHTKQRPFVCGVCGKKFSLKSNMKIHILAHQRKASKKASSDKKSSSNNKLSEDVLHHSTTACSPDADEMPDYRTRTKVRQPPCREPGRDSRKRLLSCKLCRFSCKSKADVIRHMRTHTNEQPFACDVCDKRFSRKPSLNRHFLGHTREMSQKGSNDEISPKAQLSEDVLGHPMTRAFSCDTCGEKFATENRLAAHSRLSCSQDGEDRPPRRIPTQGRRFSCGECGKSFLTKGSLVRHLLVHREDSPFICKTCGRPCYSRVHLIRHMRAHTKELPFTCDLCGKKFSLKSNMMRHRLSHSGSNPYSCGKCGLSCFSSVGLAGHIRVHMKERPFACDVCGKKFALKSNMTRHYLSHTENRPHSCEKCGIYCFSNIGLIRHMRVHTNERPFACDACGKTFALKSNMTRHCLTHQRETSEKYPSAKAVSSKVNLSEDALSEDADQTTTACCSNADEMADYRTRTDVQQLPYREPGRASEKRLLSCKLCRFSCKSKADLIRHMRKHTNERPFACDVCDRRFPRKANMARHRLAHTGGMSRNGSKDEEMSPKAKLSVQVPGYPMTRAFSCDTCGEKFATEHRLAAHTRVSCSQDGEDRPHRRISTQGRRFSCGECGKGFSTKCFLVKHSLVHREDSPFVCKTCGRAYYSRVHLNRHTRAHTKERPFACEICGKKFSYKSSMTNHRLSHTGNNSHTCEKCGLFCFSSIGLTRHLRVHTKERPFSCDVCGKKFALKSNMTRHCLTHQTDTSEKGPSAKAVSSKLKLSEGVLPRSSDDASSDDRHLERSAEGRLDTHETDRRTTGKRHEFICGECGKIFSFKHNLRRHSWIHGKTSPYMCDTCGRACSSKTNLIEHMRVHAKELPFACAVCDKKFAWKSNMTRHVISHSKHAA